MHKKGFSENVRSTFYGICKHPGLNDRELSERLKIKQTTITAIRKRLRKSGTYRIVKVPAMHKLDYGMLSVGVVELLPPREKGKGEARRNLGRLATIFPDIIHLVADPLTLTYVAVSKGYPEARATALKLEAELRRQGLTSLGPAPGAGTMAATGSDWGRVEVHYFPFDRSYIFNFFDFDTVLRAIFEVKDKSRRRIEFEPMGLTATHLLKNKQKVLWGLVDNPESFDNIVARKVGLTRQTVAKQREVFERSGLVTTKTMVSPRNMGLSMAVCVRVRFDVDASVAKRRAAIEAIHSEVPVMFHSASDNEEAIMFLSDDFEEAQKDLECIVSRYMDHHMVGTPRVNFQAVQKTETVKDLDFGALVREMETISD